MAKTMLMFTNNILINISKYLSSFPLHHVSLLRSSASLLSPIPTSSFSTAFHHRPQGGEGSKGGGGGGFGREEMYQVKQEEMAMTNDAAREGSIRAVEASDMARDSAQEAMDQGWKEAQRAANLVQHNINNHDDDPNNKGSSSNHNN